MTIDVDRIETLRGRYQRCFGCGADNPIGLRLDGFAIDERDDGSWVTAEFTPRPDYAGFADTLHGGIVATALDEASAWAAMVTENVLVFTARLEIRYRSVARASHIFAVTGCVVERRGRRLLIDAELVDDGSVVASSHGVFIVADDHTAALDVPEKGSTPRS